MFIPYPENYIINYVVDKNKLKTKMAKKIVRLHLIDKVTNKEFSVTDSDKIIRILSKPVEDIELDYDVGENVKMGTSRELIGERVQIGDEGFEMEIPEH